MKALWSRVTNALCVSTRETRAVLETQISPFFSWQISELKWTPSPRCKESGTNQDGGRSKSEINVSSFCFPKKFLKSGRAQEAPPNKTSLTSATRTLPSLKPKHVSLCFSPGGKWLHSRFWHPLSMHAIFCTELHTVLSLERTGTSPLPSLGLDCFPPRNISLFLFFTVKLSMKFLCASQEQILTPIITASLPRLAVYCERHLHVYGLEGKRMHFFNFCKTDKEDKLVWFLSVPNLCQAHYGPTLPPNTLLSR